MFKRPDNDPFAPLAVGISIGAVIVGTAVLVWNHDRTSQSHPAPLPSGTSTARTALPTLDPAVSRVASRFACSCGTCGEERLDICGCPTAQAERAFIQDQLRNGRSEAETVETVNQKYGGLKSGQPGGGANPASRLPTDDQIVQWLAQGQASPASSSTGKGLATAADRSHIISHFKCSCGQCGMVELAKCECTHPKGAVEVKRFIDDTISRSQRSVPEIVDLVQNRYGGKIR